MIVTISCVRCGRDDVVLSTAAPRLHPYYLGRAYVCAACLLEKKRN